MPSTAPGTGGVRHVAMTQATAKAAPMHARALRLLARISQARLRVARTIVHASACATAAGTAAGDDPVRAKKISSSEAEPRCTMRPPSELADHSTCSAGTLNSAVHSCPPPLQPTPPATLGCDASG